MKTKKRVLFYSLFFILLSGAIFVYHNYTAKGATYGWTQTTWSSLTGNTRNHPDEVANPGVWSEYSAIDPNISIGESISIIAETTALTHDDSTEFSAGTSQGTLTTGDQVSLDLP